ncbi:unnamed protein product [Rotaria sp. Silwood2]|nr:unnamed protein product [Rotaria sp. Silwood2]
MKYSCIELNDLPDEILLIIFKKLSNIEVLYSLQGVDKRLNRIIHDPIFTSRLNFLEWSSNRFINKFSSKFILDRFCSQILPEIAMKIKWLDLESSTMKRILRAANYPDLYGLGLYNIEEETALCLFTDENLSSGIFKNQITTLIIGIDPNENDLSTMENICNNIFTVFTNLTHLIFYNASYKNTVQLLFDFPSPSFSSSSLLVLNIKVQCFDMCLYILDGRFNQLHTLVIDLVNIHPPEEIENQKKIPNLKCFVLSCALQTSCYDELIPPLLYRMPNLEKLGLYLMAYVDETFIDGNHLKKNILNHMPQLNQFIFDICSVMYLKDGMNLPSKEEIQETFKDFQYTKIILCVNYFLERREGQCHVYSYPFLMQYYEDITNYFPGGLYQYVRVVSLYDEQSFEHEFFIRISQSFPFMEKLSVTNRHGQNQKQSYKPMNDNHNLSIVKYFYLTELNISRVHDDYIEEFLLNTKTYLQNNILLHINYKSLERMTHNFTRDDTRINCAKINEIYFFEEVKYSKSLQNYFPFAKIDE